MSRTCYLSALSVYYSLQFWLRLIAVLQRNSQKFKGVFSLHVPVLERENQPILATAPKQMLAHCDIIY